MLHRIYVETSLTRLSEQELEELFRSAGGKVESARSSVTSAPAAPAEFAFVEVSSREELERKLPPQRLSV